VQITEGWPSFTRGQAGVVHLRQVGEYGWTRSGVRAQVAAGRWQRAGRGVYALQSGALDHEQHIWTGVLSAGTGAAASHATALWLVDRTMPVPGMVHVCVPWPRSVRPLPGVVVHRLTSMAGDIHPVGTPPRLRVERAALEAAAAARGDEDAIALVSDVVQRGLSTADRLRDVLLRLPTLRRRAMLDDVLSMAGEGAHTLLEVRHEQIRRGHGLPQPRRQQRHGRAVVDVDYDGLVVELDGRKGHLDVDGWWKDMLRDDLHEAEGRAVLRFPGHILLTRPHVVAHLEAAVLTRLGWRGPLRCPTGCPGMPEADEVRIRCSSGRQNDP
jgi:very-short-patch-repair endonuclease